MSRVGVVAVLVLAGCVAHGPQVKDAKVAPTWVVRTSAKTEEEQLALQVAERLLSLARLANVAPSDVSLSVTSTGFDAVVHRADGDTPVSLSLTPTVFAAATWEPLAQELLGPWVDVSPGGIVSYVATSLETNVSATTIEKQGQVLSAELRKEPKKCLLHERAGLLALALAMREGGPLGDPRELLTLATAHLAAARYLSRRHEVFSLEGHFATALLAVMVGRENDGRSPWAMDNPGMQDFRPTVALWANGDYRIRSSKRPSSGYERLARFRAVKLRGNPVLANLLLDESVRADPVWGRLSYLRSLTPRVTEAREFGEGLRALETAEQQSVWALRKPGATVELTRPLEDDETYFVIPSELWRRHLLRQAMGAALIEHSLYAFTLRVPERAAEVLTSADAAFSSVPEWAAARLLLSRDATPADCEQGRAQLATLTPPRRSEAQEACQVAPKPDGDVVPRETAYDADLRLERAFFAPREQLDALLDRSPSSLGVRVRLLDATPPNRRTVDRALELMGPLTEYDLRALDLVSRAAAVPSREVLERQCELDSATCAALVEYLRDHDRPEVITVLERWRTHPETRVIFSVFARQLSDFYFAEGRKADAAALAKEVGDTWAGPGLELQGVFYERTGDYEKAEKTFELITQRYRDSFSVDDFHVRAMDRKYARGKYAAQGREAEARIFGGPLVRVKSKKDLAAGDVEGVPLPKMTAAYRHFGLKLTDVVLVVDGVRVKTVKQFTLMLHRSEAPTLKAIVLRDGQLLELSGPFERYRYK